MYLEIKKEKPEVWPSLFMSADGNQNVVG